MASCNLFEVTDDYSVLCREATRAGEQALIAGAK
jgi:hypothetical protein